MMMRQQMRQTPRSRRSLPRRLGHGCRRRGSQEEARRRCGRRRACAQGGNSIGIEALDAASVPRLRKPEPTLLHAHLPAPRRTPPQSRAPSQTMTMSSWSMSSPPRLSHGSSNIRSSSSGRHDIICNYCLKDIRCSQADAAKAAATTANKAVLKAAEATTPASKAGAKAKPAKPKATKPKKKKGQPQTRPRHFRGSGSARQRDARRRSRRCVDARGCVPGAYAQRHASVLHAVRSKLGQCGFHHHCCGQRGLGLDAKLWPAPGCGLATRCRPDGIPLPMIPSAVAGRNGGVPGALSSLPTSGPTSTQSTVAPSTSVSNASGSGRIHVAHYGEHHCLGSQPRQCSQAEPDAGKQCGKQRCCWKQCWKQDGQCCCGPAHATPSHPWAEDKRTCPTLSSSRKRCARTIVPRRAANSRCRRCTSGSPTDGSGSSATVGTRVETGRAPSVMRSVRRATSRASRRSDEPGKGIFYTMSDSKLAEEHRANLAKQKEEAAKAAAAAPAAPANAGPAGSLLSGGAPIPVPIRRQPREATLLPQPLRGCWRRSCGLVASDPDPSYHRNATFVCDRRCGRQAQGGTGHDRVAARDAADCAPRRKALPESAGVWPSERRAAGADRGTGCAAGAAGAAGVSGDASEGTHAGAASCGAEEGVDAAAAKPSSTRPRLRRLQLRLRQRLLRRRLVYLALRPARRTGTRLE